MEAPTLSLVLPVYNEEEIIPELDRRLRATFEGDTIRFQRPLTLEVHGRAGAPLTIIASDGFGHVAKIESSALLAPAEKEYRAALKLDRIGKFRATLR